MAQKHVQEGMTNFIKNLKAAAKTEKTQLVLREGELISEGGELKEVKVTKKVELELPTVDERPLEKEEGPEMLPIDKLVDIATKEGLLHQPTEQERWDAFIKLIKYADILKDCIQGGLNNYAKEYNKNSDEALAFQLQLRKEKREGKIFGVKLVLEMKRYGSWAILSEKHIGFTHIKDLKQKDAWMNALYGEMLNFLIAAGCNHLILQHDVQSGRIKSTISE